MLCTAANPLDSFTAEYNSDEEKKTSNEEGKEVVNENHVEQFMQVSAQDATAVVSIIVLCRVLQQLLTASQQHKRTVVI